MNKEWADKTFVRYDPWHDRDKTPNDYRTKDDKPNQYNGFKSKEEEIEHLDLLLTREEQGLPNNY